MRLKKVEFVVLESHMDDVAMVMHGCQLPVLHTTSESSDFSLTVMTHVLRFHKGQAPLS